LKEWPRISIVTPSYNQGAYIGQTVESILSQDYPNLEHIVVDGCSTDQTLDVLKSYQHLKVISEPDGGQAEAINKGFRMASGEILGYLNSDDTLLPGALRRVALEIEPEKGKSIVMGRCRFIDGSGQFLGIEHPSHFENHIRVLQVWKGHLIPQPSVFWSHQVWEKCGGMDENLGSHWIDYDLFCRFSKNYRFYCVDQVLATYRLHETSKSMGSTEADRLEEAVQISKRYWGPAVHPFYWRLAMSLALYRFDRVGRARRLFAEAKESYRQGDWQRMLIYAVPAGFLAPEVGFYVGVYPVLSEKAKGVARKVAQYVRRGKVVDPKTEVYFDHMDAWDDGFAGPCLSIFKDAPEGAKALMIEGEISFPFTGQGQSLTIVVDGLEMGRFKIEKDGFFTLPIHVEKVAAPGRKHIEIKAGAWYVPHYYLKNGDFRPLSWRVRRVDFVKNNLA